MQKKTIDIKGVTSKQNNDCYCLNCLHLFRTKNKLESHKKVCENKYFCNVVIASGNTKVLEFNHFRKSDKVSFIIYADLESLIVKIDGCKNNPEKFFTTKASENILLGFSMSTISSFKNI